MRDINSGEVITGLMLAILILMTIFFCHERGIQEAGLREMIRVEVKAEIDRCCWNILRIEDVAIEAYE